MQLNLQVPATASQLSGLCRSCLPTAATPTAAGASGLCLGDSSPKTAEPLCPSPRLEELVGGQPLARQTGPSRLKPVTLA